MNFYPLTNSYMKKEKIRFAIHWKYRTLTIQLGILEIRIYCKWNLWISKVHFYNAGKKKYIGMIWPIEILFGGTSAAHDKQLSVSNLTT